MTWEIVGIISTVLAGAVGYAIKKYVDWRVDKTLAGQLDVLKKAYVERFDTIVRIKGMLREMDHYMDHLKKNHLNYVEICKEWCMKVRQESRASIALIGEDVVSYIIELTNVALEYSDKPSTDLYDQWKQRYSDIHSPVNSSLPALKITPTANNSFNPTPR